jgi:hypothetical protein
MQLKILSMYADAMWPSYWLIWNAEKNFNTGIVMWDTEGQARTGGGGAEGVQHPSKTKFKKHIL